MPHLAHWRSHLTLESRHGRERNMCVSIIHSKLTSNGLLHAADDSSVYNSHSENQVQLVGPNRGLTELYTKRNGFIGFAVVNSTLRPFHFPNKKESVLLWAYIRGYRVLIRVAHTVLSLRKP